MIFWQVFNAAAAGQNLILVKAHLHYDKNAAFRVKLAGFMEMIKLSLEIKWPRLARKRCVFVAI